MQIKYNDGQKTTIDELDYKDRIRLIVEENDKDNDKDNDNDINNDINRKRKKQNEDIEANVYQSEQERLQRQVQSLSDDLAVSRAETENSQTLIIQFQKTVDTLQNRNNTLQNQNNTLNKLLNDHKKKLAEKSESGLKEKSERCYIRKKVLTYNAKDKTQIMIHKNIKKKQKDIQNEVNIHQERLTKWNEISTELQNEFKSCDIQPGADDEKKESAKKSLKSTALLHSYVNCMKLLQIQKSRIEDIGEHVTSLGKSKKSLKNIVKEYNNNQQPLQQQYNKLCASYTELNSHRIHLQVKVKNMINEINKITEEENILNKQKCNKLNYLNVSVVEKEKYDQLLSNCKSLITQYNKFDESIDNKSDELRKYFGKKWDGHERLWTKWHVDDIICWIKYLSQSNKIQLSKEIDLKKIEKEMKMQKFKGKSLSKLEKNDLKLFGIMVFDDYHQLWSMIRKLVEKYPVVVDSENNSDVEGVHLVQKTVKGPTIPKEYLCPISKKIMYDPVIYDGITYERGNFKQYVVEHKKIPGCDEIYDDDEEIILTKNRKLKQKIDAFLDVNQQYMNEGV